MLEQLSAFIIHLIQSMGYFGTFLLMFLSGALIPIPSEVTMPFSGYLASKGIFWLPFVIMVGAFGDLLGSLIGYFIGLILEEEVLIKFIRKYGKFILISEHEFNKARDWFSKHGGKVVFIGKFIPGIRTYIALPAGISKMKLWKFCIFAFSGTLVWGGFLAYVGYYLGKNWQLFGAYFRKFEILIFIILIVTFLYVINSRLKIIKFGKKKN
jgi:membrane protein DedA with SNARE-associated domain